MVQQQQKAKPEPRPRQRRQQSHDAAAAVAAADDKEEAAAASVDVLTTEEDGKEMEALFDEETTFESVNERIASGILKEIMSQEATGDLGRRMGDDATMHALGLRGDPVVVRKSQEERMRQKLVSLSSSLHQVRLLLLLHVPVCDAAAPAALSCVFAFVSLRPCHSVLSLCFSFPCSLSPFKK